MHPSQVDARAESQYIYYLSIDNNIFLSKAFLGYKQTGEQIRYPANRPCTGCEWKRF